MPEKTAPNLGLKYGYVSGEEGWGPGYNAAHLLIDTLLQAGVIAADLTAPPVSPANGDRYIVLPVGTGDWLGHDNALAVYLTDGASWVFFAPRAGWRVWDAATDRVLRFDGTEWGPEIATVVLPAATSSVRGGVTVAAGAGVKVTGDALTLDLDALGTARGDILYRSAGAWTVLAPGTVGDILTTGGAGADPSWEAPTSGGVTTFAALTDGFALTGHASAPVRVNAAATALEPYNPPYDVSLYAEEPLTDGEVLMRLRPRACSFPAGAASSYGDAGVAATGAVTLTAKKNGATFATFAWSAAGTVATVAIASATTFNGTSDILSFEGSATHDATLARITLTLAGTRS